MKNKFNIAIIFILFFVSGIAGFSLSFYFHQKKIQPIVSNHMQTYHYPTLFVGQLKNDPQAGRKIFNEFCSACHAEQPAIDVNAPRIGDKAVWSALRQSGIQQLLKITLEGAGAMPARGGCFECSDHQLLLAIQYILDKSH
jgi:cytochrome c5